MSHPFRLLTVLLSVIALLASTAAMAGYVCPGGEQSIQLSQSVEADGKATTPHEVDDVQMLLCHAHCQSAQKSADTFKPAVFADLMRLGPVLTVTAVRPALPRPREHIPGELLRNSAPSLAIRHCCYRT